MPRDDWGLGPDDDDELTDLTDLHDDRPHRTSTRQNSRRRSAAPPTAVSTTVLVGFIVVAVTVMITLLLPEHTVLKLPGAWFATVNGVAFLLCGLDKRLAIKRRFRVPGNVILLMAIAGGALGTLLSLISFRHKVRKGHFFIKIAAILVVQILAIYFALYFKIITLDQVLNWLITS